ncbi:hypothetical protein PG911_11760 [Tenacibaculum ovolyticum]|uniref:hypothetical protein n=1 Tax=Tenacibaculum ovolyticum TaxID=104270 RepID=UPI0022F396A6|nr:hypothetical protein [Tenacibaculum ovolyticum]WBX75332.1 hypothetical protein PG911_11760 [Tenacibaculum ovolyticum]
MKNILLTLIIGIILYSCSASKIENNKTKYFDKNNKTRYFDENNLEISESKYNQIRSTNKLLYIVGDSINHKKLTLREKRGKINDRSGLELLLEKTTKIELDSTKPIVIIYYPGKDENNSGAFKNYKSNSYNRKLIKQWYEQLEWGLNQVAKIKPLYIYKDSEGLKKYNGILKWNKDPEKTIERLFFKYHYPGSSFVVISKNGDYISYFGEFGKKYVWEATQIMNK